MVDLDFDQSRVDIENYHILFGLIIFYVTLVRLIFKLLTPAPDFKDNAFLGQKFLAKLNHFFLYLLYFQSQSQEFLKNYLMEKVCLFFLKKLI